MAKILGGITFWRSLDTRLNEVTKASDDMVTILHPPPQKLGLPIYVHMYTLTKQ